MDFLRTLRALKNKKQKEVATAAGITGSYYSMIETGERRPSPEVAKKIAVVLGFENEWYKLLEENQEQKGAI
ncbi:helix-turn-helix domain-containing protein [Selenomonas artemidis]|uniref:helix-turn-helix domain-containing protein n=1 Tax=Selenomonas artemidis TaxID=671224 RepID=UPI00288A88BC|nr:helix-turn-helix transcriptional regulator [Selenomonas artemidis]